MHLIYTIAGAVVERITGRKPSVADAIYTTEYYKEEALFYKRLNNHLGWDYV